MGGLYFLGVVHYAFLHSSMYNVLIFELIHEFAYFPYRFVMPFCY